MTLHERFAELRAEELRNVPPFALAAPASRRLAWRRPAAAFAIVALIVVLVFTRRPHPTFTPADRAAAHAIAAWHPPTDVLLRMPSTGVSR